MNRPSDAINVHPSSYRDPSGFIFTREGVLRRQVNHSYARNYDQLLATGLFHSLVSSGELISHEEEDIRPADPSLAYKILRPETVPFISFPCEWSFSQLKDAALLTLSIQRAALTHNMSLKDASAFNVQFLRGRPVFIDTLSFEVLEPEKPWIAYRQFCEHFLAPLTLMSKVDVRLGLIQHEFINGVPLDLASTLLPLSSRLLPQLLIHLHLHSKSQKRFEGKQVRNLGLHMGKNALLGLIDNLESTVKKLSLNQKRGGWTEYYSTCTYSDQNFNQKMEFVDKAIAAATPATLWDLGCNTGAFSFAASAQGVQTLALDSDHDSIDRMYSECRNRTETRILPLILDIANPTSAAGWAGEERSAFQDRGRPDMLLALALVHHLAISKNVPLDRIATFFADTAPSIVIEFVPKNDPQTRRLLRSRTDVFPEYEQASFETVFCRHFRIEMKEALSESGRVLYFMKRPS